MRFESDISAGIERGRTQHRAAAGRVKYLDDVRTVFVGAHPAVAQTMDAAVVGRCAGPDACGHRVILSNKSNSCLYKQGNAIVI